MPVPGVTMVESRGRVLVEYLVLSETVVVFGVRADWAEPQVTTVPVERSTLMAFVESCFGSGGRVRDLVDLGMTDAWHVYDSLVKPLLRWSAPGDVVYLVPHGPLHYLPLHALLVEGRPLVERNPVVYSPSASVLGLLPPRRAHHTATPKALVLGDSRNDLPHARAEAVELAGSFGVEPMLGAAVTRTVVTDGFATADIVHVAGHGQFDGTDALASGVCLAAGEMLTAADVLGLPPMHPSVVTLSGCETGVSQLRPGDELIGLTRAFLYARTPALVVSLWSVADDSTAYLMRRFYTHLRGGTLSTAHALRQAMVDTMNEPGWSSFYHWAPFILIGDWR